MPNWFRLMLIDLNPNQREELSNWLDENEYAADDMIEVLDEPYIEDQEI